ncbi:MAG: hypothetical protein LAO79_02305 [Acidobacteriia bacterium]|nr:hypothetical protein [Terriglobia bacterium]
MKKLMGALLAVSMLTGTASLSFAQDKQDAPKKDGKDTGKKGDKKDDKKGDKKGGGY